MAPKTKGSSSKKQLKATIKRVEAKLERADAKAAGWKKKAKRHQAAGVASQARIATLERQVAKAKNSANKPMATGDAQQPSPRDEVLREKTR